VSNRNHLHRLEAGFYRGDAIVHWSLTMLNRKQGWLNGLFYYRFREILTHTAFRYAIACPIFCLMPDHLHMVWMGVLCSDERQDQAFHDVCEYVARNPERAGLVWTAKKLDLRLI